jgi:hypothetical protein
MHKLMFLTAGVAMFMAGCESAKPSKTWEMVKAAPRSGPRVEDRCGVYAGQLHKLLQDAGVEHKVVTFTFMHPTRLMVDARAQDVAVIYKDAASPDHPWWLMTEYLWSPVWLPNQSLERQIDFYLARPSRVVSVAEYPTSNPADGKSHRRAKKKASVSAGKPGKPVTGRTEPGAKPFPGEKPAGSPTSGNKSRDGSAPGTKPADDPGNTTPDRTREPNPKVEPPPVRTGPSKTIPVRLDAPDRSPGVLPSEAGPEFA